MVTAIEAITGQIRAGLCFVLDTYENAGRALSNIIGTPTGIGEAAGALGVLLCDKPPDPVPLPDPPFTGGQCNAIYIVNFTVTNNLNAEVFTGNRRARGPIGGARIAQSGSSFVAQIFCRGFNLSSGTCGPVTDTGAGWYFTGFGGSLLEGGSCTINSVTPCGVDDCGDLPTPVPPAGDIIIEGDDVTYNIDESTEITVPIALVFAPVYVAIDGTLRIPVNIDLGGLDFSGEVTIAPEFNVEISPTFNPPGPGVPDDPDEIGEPGEPSTPIDDEEELESTIVGVLVYSDIDPDGLPSSILFPTGPNIYVPRLASVQFAVKTQNSIGWTPDQDVKNLECYVPCPAPQGAIAVRVSPMPGVQSRFTAVRGKPLTSF